MSKNVLPSVPLKYFSVDPTDSATSPPMSSIWLHVLVALAAGECPVYGINRRIVAQSVGGVVLSRTTVYAAVKRLVAEGLVEEDGVLTSYSGKNIRPYRLTPEGWRALRQEEDRLKTLHRSLRERLTEYDHWATNVI